MRVAETGTGVGFGAAWIVSALEASVPFFTAELDEGRAAAAAELFREDENVHVLEGDWHDVLPPHAPFDLLFHDGSKRRPDLDGDETLGLVAPRGLVVLDDLTPGRKARPRAGVLARPPGPRSDRDPGLGARVRDPGRADALRQTASDADGGRGWAGSTRSETAPRRGCRRSSS